MAGGSTSTIANFGYQNVPMELYTNQSVKHSVNYKFYYISIHLLSILPMQCTRGLCATLTINIIVPVFTVW